MLTLSRSAIEAMGYTEHHETHELDITFGIINVYTLRGIDFETDCVSKSSEVFRFGDNCTLVVSHSVNDGCNLLISDNFTDEDEGKWLSDRNAKPPFVLIYFKESASRKLRGGFRQSRDGHLFLYDAFPDGKAEIREWKKRLLPRIITSLTVHFSTLERQVQLVPVEESIFGITKDGQTVFDHKLTGKILGYSSIRKILEESSLSLNRSENLFLQLDEKSSRHIYAALNDPDRLEQFLSYCPANNYQYILMQHTL